jgi:hypothetical protein
MSGIARVCTDDSNTLVRTHSDARVTTQLSTIADVKNKEDLLDYEDDPDDVQWPDDPFELSAETKSADDLLAMINICGSPCLQRNICAPSRRTCRPWNLKLTWISGKPTGTDYRHALKRVLRCRKSNAK